MSDIYKNYTTDYISHAMSLRKPQKKSLEILDSIIRQIDFRKDADIAQNLETVKSIAPTCSDFEREFMSLAFALATGVGKTRLMGAFIAYLYTQHDIKNFFVVAPSTTIYNKLRSDLSDFNSEKYVFRGLECFAVNRPQLIDGNDYNSATISLFESDVRIYVFNIDKFNSEDANMRKFHENLGHSFFSYLSQLPDLVVIMDESHHYHAPASSAALNELHPLLGLELTATPYITTASSKQILFKNVVYEYPLSQSIADGYTRTPYAITRANFESFHFGEEQIDKLMINDGIKQHERFKNELRLYADTHQVKYVKPFMMISCKDTEHAAWVEEYVRSDAFRNGAYKNKTITVTYKKAQSEANMKLLLEIERADNPVEVLIQVNMLKEGWDVNNLFTIVPLRASASMTLREQMVGRGLRLPYGERTGNQTVDSVMLTAHDKFRQILEEAQKGDSIFKAGNIITVEQQAAEEEVFVESPLFPDEPDKFLTESYEQTGLDKTEENDRLLNAIKDILSHEVTNHIQSTPQDVQSSLTESSIDRFKEKVETTFSDDEDTGLGELFRRNYTPLIALVESAAQKIHTEAIKHFIPIPQIQLNEVGNVQYVFESFEINLGRFPQQPLEHDLLIKQLTGTQTAKFEKTDSIDFEGYEPEKQIRTIIRNKPEVDYDEHGRIINALIKSVCTYFESKYGENGLKNIVMMYKHEIANEIYSQMLEHFNTVGSIIEENIFKCHEHNIAIKIKANIEKFHLNDNNYGGKSHIKSVAFNGIEKGAFAETKFDSHEELLFARTLEQDNAVLNWLKPAQGEFNINYLQADHSSHSYLPDFVVETDDCIYLVEIKDHSKLEDPNVLAKKERGIKYCSVVTAWAKTHQRKPWKYMFIPDNRVGITATFDSYLHFLSIM